MCRKYFQQSVVLCNCLFISILQKALFCVVKQAVLRCKTHCFTLQKCIFQNLHEFFLKFNILLLLHDSIPIVLPKLLH